MKKNKENHLFIVFSNLDLGGVQRKMVDIANYISRNKKYINTIVHIIVKEEGNFSFRGFLDKNSPQIKIHVSSEYLSGKLVNKFHNHIFYFLILLLSIKYKPVTIFTFFHFTLPCLVLAKIILLFKTKIIIGQDNLPSFYNNKKHINVVFPPWIIKKLYNFADVILTQTNYAKKDLTSNFGIKSKKIIVIPNWVVDIEYRKLKKEHDLIYCGRFAKQKRIEKIIQVFSKINKSIPNTKLCLMGSGDEKNKIVKQIKKNNLEKNVLLLPPSYKVKNEILKSKLFILTSDFEGHPMVLIEAMALGVIPVILEYPGVEEYVMHEVSGFIEKDLENLKKRVIDLLSNPKLLSKISKQTKQIAFNDYGVNLVKETVNILLT